MTHVVRCPATGAFCIFMLMAITACGPRSSGQAALLDGGARADLSIRVVHQDAGGVAPPDLYFDTDAFWAQDPPLMACGSDGGALPPARPGGTPDCPDDKNREGCDCPSEGMTVACWPGLRANRNLGVCVDGTTTCVKAGELGLRWGPCVDYRLPSPGFTTGAQACKCFSAGQWKLDNLSPCFANDGTGWGSGGVTSSVLDANQATLCPAAHALPVQPWSADTLRADCAGHFKLCYALKAGDAKNPQPNDCVIVEVCTEGDYATTGKEQPFPPLPSFVADSMAARACALQFTTNGGYGEMRVDGVTVTCDKVERVFNRVRYCPLACDQDPQGPNCAACGHGGGGNF